LRNNARRAQNTYWVRRAGNELRVKMVKDAHLNGSQVIRPKRFIVKSESSLDLLEQVAQRATKMVLDP
jgi:hypothetical protein